MKYEEFYKKLGVTGADAAKAKRILMNSSYKKNIKTKFTGEVIEGDTDEIIAYVKAQLDQENEEKKQEEQVLAQAKAEENNLNEEAMKIMVTSGYNFEGYNITKYTDFVSGDGVTIITRGKVFGENCEQDVSSALTEIRKKALQKLKRAAFDLGCNAIVGVDYDYVTFEMDLVSGPTVVNAGIAKVPYTVCVTANGTAVIVEKE